MVAPNAICQTQTGVATPGNPCHLSAVAASSGLGDWEYLANHIPPASVRSELRSRFTALTRTGREYHDILEAHGPISLDFYPIEVHQLPYPTPGQRVLHTDIRAVDASMPRMTALELFHYIRGNLQYFASHGSNFEPYEDRDGVRWRGMLPVGAVFHIDMLVDVRAPWWLGGFRLPSPADNPDDGAVVCSEFATASGEAHWIFSTIPTLGDGQHPVSGNRQFGYATRRRGDVLPEFADTNASDRRRLGSPPFWTTPATEDVVYIYTRGADRTTTPLDSAMSGRVFAGAHGVWTAFQNRVAQWINSQGGRASIPGYMANRWDFDRYRREHIHRSAGQEWTGRP